MSVTFFALLPDGSRISLDIEQPAHLNLANGNARALLCLLGIGPGDSLCGEIPIYKARRAVIRGRATFERRAGSFVRRADLTPEVGPPICG